MLNNMLRCEEFEALFPTEDEETIARGVADYFRRQKTFPYPVPIACDDSLLAYFKEEWQGLVDRGELCLSSVCASKDRKMIKCEDVRVIMPEILEKLVRTGHLDRHEYGYKAASRPMLALRLAVKHLLPKKRTCPGNQAA